MKNRAIVFDMDYTLYDESQYFYCTFQSYCNLKKYETKILDRMMHGYHFFRAQSKDIFKDVLVDINDYSLNNHNQLFDLFKNVSCEINLYDDAVEVLEFLKKDKIKKAVLTNGNVLVQANKVKLLGLNKYFTNITYGRENGGKYEKPHVSAFERVLKKMELWSFNEVIFVGDNPSTDLVTPKNMGAKTIRLLRGPNKVKDSMGCADVEINSLTKILEYL